MFHSPDTDFKLFCSFLKMPITQPFIEILATKACVAVRSSPSTLSLQISPPETPSSSFSGSYLPPMYSFIRELVVGSRVQPATLFGTMVYLERIRWRLPDSFFSAPDAAYRALLSCLILSGKYLNDAAPKNKHWSTYCKIYSELLVEYRAFSHLPHSAVPLPLISPLASNFPITPKSAVFPRP
ncbi:PHO85 cyclin-1 [Massospora cicadina]|nr:PHO85 cyclin-1 [Massospora cicadina]